MAEQDEPLDEEEFDMAATRPPMTLGLPHTLSCSLLAFGLLFLMLYGSGNWFNDLIGDSIALGALGMLWSTAKFALRDDYHGWGNLVAWMQLDARCLDTREWGGARLASLPLRSIYRTGACDDAG